MVRGMRSLRCCKLFDPCRCVGKATLALALVQRCGLVRVELDGIWWGPNWADTNANDIAARVAERIGVVGGWVADGNYLDEVASVLWSGADVIVWLDLPRRVGFAGAVYRSTRRVSAARTLGMAIVRTGVCSPRHLVALWRRWPDYPSCIKAVAQSNSSNPSIQRV